MTDAEHLDIIKARLARTREAFMNALQNTSYPLCKELAGLEGYLDDFLADVEFVEAKVYPPEEEEVFD